MKIKFAATLIAALVSSAVVCANAFAEYIGPVWELNSELVKASTVVSIKSSALELQDTELGAIECRVTGEGKVGAEGTGEVTSLSASECKSVKTCEAGTASAKAVHLPWKTQLISAEEVTVRDKFSSGGGGAPGWIIECKVLGANTTDECTGETTAAVEDAYEGPSVQFDAKSAHLNCSFGGSGKGIVSGPESDHGPESKELSVADLAFSILGTSGAGVPNQPSCVFTAGGQECELEFRNLNPFETYVYAKEISAPSGRYTISREGCTFDILLLQGASCRDKIRVTTSYVKGWLNAFYIRGTTGAEIYRGWARASLVTR